MQEDRLILSAQDLPRYIMVPTTRTLFVQINVLFCIKWNNNNNNNNNNITIMIMTMINDDNNNNNIFFLILNILLEKKKKLFIQNTIYNSCRFKKHSI